MSAPACPPDELLRIIADYDALVVRSETKVTAAVFAAGKQLQAVGRAGVGVDNIDLDAATERGVIVVNAPLGNTISAAEHTIGLMLALARHIPDANASLQGRRLGALEVRGRRGARQDARAHRPRQRRLRGRAPRQGPRDERRRPRPLHLAGTRRRRSASSSATTLDELLGRADFLSLHTAHRRDRNIIGERELTKVKPSRCASSTPRRGEPVDYDALVEGARRRPRRRRRARCLPAGAARHGQRRPPQRQDHRHAAPRRLTAEAQERVAVDVAEQILAILRGEPAMYAVNAPMIAAETMTVLAPYLPVAAEGRVARHAARARPDGQHRDRVPRRDRPARHDAAQGGRDPGPAAARSAKRT